MCQRLFIADMGVQALCQARCTTHPSAYIGVTKVQLSRRLRPTKIQRHAGGDGGNVDVTYFSTCVSTGDMSQRQLHP